MSLADHLAEKILVMIKCDLRFGPTLSRRILRHVQEQAIVLGLIEHPGA